MDEVSQPVELIHLTEQTDLTRVQSFYASVGYGCEINRDDRILLARVDNRIIAAVRLSREFDQLVLRGMYVAEERRGQGVGTRLLESTSAVIDESECWCIPFARLANFYSRIGFRVCEGGDIPLFLADRRKKYTTGGKKVVIMKRTTAWSRTPRPD